MGIEEDSMPSDHELWRQYLQKLLKSDRAETRHVKPMPILSIFGGGRVTPRRLIDLGDELSLTCEGEVVKNNRIISRKIPTSQVPVFTAKLAALCAELPS